MAAIAAISPAAAHQVGISTLPDSSEQAQLEGVYALESLCCVHMISRLGR